MSRGGARGTSAAAGRDTGRLLDFTLPSTLGCVIRGGYSSPLVRWRADYANQGPRYAAVGPWAAARTAARGAHRMMAISDSHYGRSWKGPEVLLDEQRSDPSGMPRCSGFSFRSRDVEAVEEDVEGAGEALWILQARSPGQLGQPCARVCEAVRAGGTPQRRLGARGGMGLRHGLVQPVPEEVEDREQVILSAPRALPQGRIYRHAELLHCRAAVGDAVSDIRACARSPG